MLLRKCHTAFAHAHLYRGDSLEIMRSMPENSVDTIITDPPYGLAFMSRAWDSFDSGFDFQKFMQRAANAMRRVLKPGGLLLAFGGTRMWHHLAMGIERAGFQIVDTIMWVYGSGFPKSIDVSKAIDKELGEKRKVTGVRHVRSPNKKYGDGQGTNLVTFETSPASVESKLWEGYGTALKPAWEPIVVALNPVDGNYAQNALTHGVAGLNIDECRVPTDGPSPSVARRAYGAPVASVGPSGWRTAARPKPYSEEHPGELKGRWPANLIHDGSKEVTRSFPRSKSTGGKGKATRQAAFSGPVYNDGWARNKVGRNAGGLGDDGSAARFFYCAKASRRERGDYNDVPTVKPIKLMRYLCRLTKTPARGIVLDPFAGSGTTGIAALLEGRRFIGIDSDPQAFRIAVRRFVDRFE